MNIITCRECGSERQSRWKTTEYCLVCRYLSNAKYIAERDRTTKCMECRVTFTPLKRDDKFCPECAPVPRSAPTGTCGLCEREDQPLLAREISVCRTCAYSADKRETLIHALGKKKRARIKDPYVVPEHERPAAVVEV